jgi:hypothetical protein
MEGVKLKLGLQTAMFISGAGNLYMQDTKPWELKQSAPDRAATIVNTMASLVRLLAAVLEPFMPGFTDKVRELASPLLLSLSLSPSSSQPPLFCAPNAPAAEPHSLPPSPPSLSLPLSLCRCATSSTCPTWTSPLASSLALPASQQPVQLACLAMS